MSKIDKNKRAGEKQLFEKVVIIGVGLIGGSLGMALCKRSLSKVVVGVGRNEENLRMALKCNAVHQISTNVVEAVKDAEIVVLATHVRAAQDLLREILPFLSPGCVVTDVGSTKGEIVYLASQLMPPEIFFVGGHPMAGSERQGVLAGDPCLFEGACYILTPTPDLPKWALDKIRFMVLGVGARVIEMSCEAHDQAVAAVSHLPHLMAAALVNTLAFLPEREKILPLAAGGFKDTTRIAMSNPLMWRDIFLSNREMLLSMVNIFRDQLDLLEDVIRNQEDAAMLELLQKARKVRLGLQD